MRQHLAVSQPTGVVMPYKDKERKRLKDREYRERNKERRAEQTRLWYQNNPERARENDKHWRASNSEKVKQKTQRWVAANQEKVEAHAKVNRRVRAGLWPKASVFVCSDCVEPALDYHHENYALWWSVEPLCRVCHKKRHCQTESTD